MPATIACDIADDGLAEAVCLALAPRPCHRVAAKGETDAVALVADLGARSVVVAADVERWRQLSDTATESQLDDMYTAVALVTGWWATATDVVDAFVVLVSHVHVFGDGDVPVDEFSSPTPVTPLGRALLAAEQLAAAATGGAAIVRDGGSDVVEVADLVAWAVTSRRPGTWHVGGSPRLGNRHTRLTRAATGPGSSS